MQARRTWLFATRGVVAAAGLVVLLALQPEPAGLIEAAGRPRTHAPAPLLSHHARRHPTLQYRSSPTQVIGCMIGEIPRNAPIVRRVAPPRAGTRRPRRRRRRRSAATGCTRERRPRKARTKPP